MPSEKPTCQTLVRRLGGAKIVEFSRAVWSAAQGNVRLPCRAVGAAPVETSWTFRGLPLAAAGLQPKIRFRRGPDHAIHLLGPLNLICILLVLFVCYSIVLLLVLPSFTGFY